MNGLVGVGRAGSDDRCLVVGNRSPRSVTLGCGGDGARVMDGDCSREDEGSGDGV